MEQQKYNSHVLYIRGKFLKSNKLVEFNKIVGYEVNTKTQLVNNQMILCTSN